MGERQRRNEFRGTEKAESEKAIGESWQQINMQGSRLGKRELDFDVQTKTVIKANLNHFSSQDIGNSRLKSEVQTVQPGKYFAYVGIYVSLC